MTTQTDRYFLKPEFPGHVKVEAKTPIGDAEVVSWGDAFVVHIKDASLNRVSYNVRFDPILLTDGTYGKKDHHTLMISKNDSVKYSDYTWAAYEKALDVLTTWINEFASANPEFIRDGYKTKHLTTAFHAWAEWDRKRSETQIAAVNFDNAITAAREYGYSID